MPREARDGRSGDVQEARNAARGQDGRSGDVQEVWCRGGWIGEAMYREYGEAMYRKYGMPREARDGRRGNPNAFPLSMWARDVRERRCTWQGLLQAIQLHSPHPCGSDVRERRCTWMALCREMVLCRSPVLWAKKDWLSPSGEGSYSPIISRGGNKMVSCRSPVPWAKRNSHRPRERAPTARSYLGAKPDGVV